MGHPHLQVVGKLNHQLLHDLLGGLEKVFQPSVGQRESASRTAYLFAHRRRLGRIAGMVNISKRPATVDDRAIPGDWEGDLILGSIESGSAIGTLVERSTRYAMLLHLPDNHTVEALQEAIVAKMPRLPTMLRKTLTWDQGKEMANHAKITKAIDLDIYFCDPHSPGQRGTNENTWPSAPIVSQRHRPVSVPRGLPGLRRRQTQQPATQDPRLENTRPSPRRTTIQPVRSTRCCTSTLKPPWMLLMYG